jgi:hypothetical protein
LLLHLVIETPTRVPPPSTHPSGAPAFVQIVGYPKKRFACFPRIAPPSHEPHGHTIYADEDKAREHLESIQWPDGPVCPKCGNCDPKRITKLQQRIDRI